MFSPFFVVIKEIPVISEIVKKKIINMHLLGIFFALGAGIFFGILAPTTKIAYNLGVGVGIAIVLRYFVASLLIAPFIPFQKNLLGVYKKFFLDFVLITFGSILLTSGLLLSVKFIDVSLAIIIFCTYPIFVLIFSIIIDKEIIPNIIKFLFLSTFIGLFFALGPAVSSLNAFGFLCAITASIGATTMIVANQKMSNKSISPIQINIFINFFNAIFFFCLLSLFFSLDFSISKVDFFVILIPSFSYAIALLLQLLAIPRIGQSLTALFLYLEPVVAIIGSVILLKENLNNYQIFGSILVLSSLGFATYFTDKSKNDSS